MMDEAIMDFFIGAALLLVAVNQWRLEDRIKTLERHSLSVGTGVMALLRQSIGYVEEPNDDDPFRVTP